MQQRAPRSMAKRLRSFDIFPKVQNRNAPPFPPPLNQLSKESLDPTNQLRDSQWKTCASKLQLVLLVRARGIFFVCVCV
jgi:hypothetical protein